MQDAEIALIRNFISDHVNGLRVEEDEDVFAAGYVNSLFVVQLVTWVERTFDVTVGTEDLDFENFRSAAAVASFVDRKRGQLEAGTGAREWTSV
jgi:acyl carrier protein